VAAGRAVLDETMRLYPPAYMVVRRATRTVPLGAYEVKKGEAVLVNIIGMHHRADLFPEPTEFSPDRFSPEAEKAIPRHAYLPFGGGPRACMGDHFAMLEASLALATIVRRAKICSLSGDFPTVTPLTMIAAAPVRARVERCTWTH